MKLEYDSRGIPMMVIEKPNARITITFNENPDNPKLKETILDILSASCQDNVVNGKI